jgi:hypothetical protein
LGEKEEGKNCKNIKEENYIRSNIKRENYTNCSTRNLELLFQKSSNQLGSN